jgi:putative phosphotransacetylase
MTSIPVEVSARHIHITEADWRVLFGDGEMTSERAISQPGQFVDEQHVTIRGPKGKLKNIGIVGPFRPYTQVELAMTDARALGIDAPLSDSGSVDHAATITIIGPWGELERAAAIVPKRHIHISPAEATAAGLHNRQIVSVRISGPRGAQLDQVIVRVHPKFIGRLHLDTDEGNACGVTPGATAEIVV